VKGVPDTAPPSQPLKELAQRLSALEAAREEMACKLERAEQERDEYRRVYLALLEAYRKLEAGLFGQKRERFVGAESSEQLALSLLAMMTNTGAAPTSEDAPVQKQKVEAHERAKPTGRKPLPEHLPRIHVEVVPPEVQRAGLEAFERIGEESSEVVEHRPSSLVVVRTVRPKFVPKQKLEEIAAVPVPPGTPEDVAVASTPVLQAPAPELPLPRSLCGPGLLADTIVRRWQDHLPLHRLERIYGREGLELPRSTVCDWHAAAALLVKPLIEAMWKDALTHSAYLCMDATGVLVQELEKCRRAHFFVVVAPQKHVLFGYQPKHDSAAVDALLKGYQGFLVADAHAVYDHLYLTGDVIEVGCWAHARRYWFKALDTDGARARHGLSLLQALFKLERQNATMPPEEKLRHRQTEAKPIVEAFFRYCDEEELKVVDETPIAKAIGYARNQREALARFLSDGRLPIHNNHSENALRREALGRKNWLFLGSDEGGTVNATFVTLLASCQLHGLEPLGYLRDMLCLLPGWPVQRVLELAPANWTATMQRVEVRAELDANVFRQAALGLLTPAATK
jgi:transposase